MRLTRRKPDTQSGAAGKAPPGSGAGGGRCPVLPSLCSLLAEPSGHHEPPPASPSPASLRAPLGTGEITFLSRAADLAKIRRAPLVPSLHSENLWSFAEQTSLPQRLSPVSPQLHHLHALCWPFLALFLQNS